ncbi:MAG: hypothetical protein QOG03_736 [Actinomycetota bacterium]|jgi:hypothetical protein|nr:hypothetical protein [Actinomycetota bacterium]
MATAAGAKVRRTLKRDDDVWVQRLGRAGLGSRGVVYLVVAFLAARVAFGDRGEEADRQGALQTIARQPFGHVLLIVLGLGFLGYACWRLFTAATNRGRSDDAKSWAKRVAEAARGLLYLSFAFSTAKLALFGKATSGAQQQASWTAKLLKLPFGKPLVIAIGLAVIAGGLVSIWRGLARRFEKHLKEWEIPDGVEGAVNATGLAGFVGRGVAFCLVGGFLVQAALSFNPQKARGLDGALKNLASHPYGTVVLAVVALGLLAFGAYSMAEARFRRILGS